MAHRRITPLTRQRAFATIKVVAKAMQDGETAITYSELANRLGMSKVNGQGLASYLNEAAAICAEHNLPNVSCVVVSKDSLERGAPMPSEGSFSDDHYAASGLTREDVPAEQERVRQYDWRSLPTLDLDD
ncbi:hypothetical protein [uncultured Limimaricola sp.]|uniref:hypothetical protein n=1 Tax=uncultured Limimaricola sp. TaxID=2211667 RepID=UPI0030FAC498